MIIYEVTIMDDAAAEGFMDLYYSNLADANKSFNEAKRAHEKYLQLTWIEDEDERYLALQKNLDHGKAYPTRLNKITLADLSPKVLALACLNGAGWAKKVEMIREYEPSWRKKNA